MGNVYVESNENNVQITLENAGEFSLQYQDIRFLSVKGDGGYKLRI